MRTEWLLNTVRTARDVQTDKRTDGQARGDPYYPRLHTAHFQ